LLVVAGLGGRTPAASAASAIETTYRAVGPWAVSTGSASAFGGTYKLYYPTNLGSGGFDHPILTWGNGTNATPSKYDGILTHLASWGFVVIASDSGSTGLGTQILDGAYYLVNQDANPASIFYQNLDIANVGALGHSQGAGGAQPSTRAGSSPAP
jgi:predicted dienelactone hydrolase